MRTYLLFESSSGYGLFDSEGVDEIGQNTEAVRNSITDLERFGKAVKLAAFQPFESALDALKQCNAVSEGHFSSIPFVQRIARILLWFIIDVVRVALCILWLVFSFYALFWTNDLVLYKYMVH